MDSLSLLYRTVVVADNGNQQARKILDALLDFSGAGLLGLGFAGILVAAGMGWLIADNNYDEDGESGTKE